jgi:hypothetical protein
MALTQVERPPMDARLSQEWLAASAGTHERFPAVCPARHEPTVLPALRLRRPLLHGKHWMTQSSLTTLRLCSSSYAFIPRALWPVSCALCPLPLTNQKLPWHPLRLMRMFRKGTVRDTGRLYRSYE